MTHKIETVDLPSWVSYTLWDELAADPKAPIKPERTADLLKRLDESFVAIKENPSPSLDDWRYICDAANLLVSIDELGYLSDGAFDQLTDLTHYMAETAAWHRAGGELRFTPAGIELVTALLSDFREILAQLSDRDFVRLCRRTQRRLREILKNGKKDPRDLVVDL